MGRIRDELRRAMALIKMRGDDRGQKLAEHLCEEAPAERPYVRRDDDRRHDLVARPAWHARQPARSGT